jgi:hypothetical protein
MYPKAHVLEIWSQCRAMGTGRTFRRWSLVEGPYVIGEGSSSCTTAWQFLWTPSVLVGGRKLLNLSLCSCWRWDHSSDTCSSFMYHHPVFTKDQGNEVCSNLKFEPPNCELKKPIDTSGISL